MTNKRTLATLILSAALSAGCSGDATGTDGGKRTVAGTMSFVLGGTLPASASIAALRGSEPSAPRSLKAGAEYLLSPQKAKIVFTSVVFKDQTGATLGSSTFSACSVTYDRSLSAGSSLLDCPFTVPAGEIAQILLGFDHTIQLLVSDPATGIYSSPASATGYATSAPAGGAAFVPLVFADAGPGGESNSIIVLATPITITEGSSPHLYVTTDLIQGLHLQVNADGTTLSQKGSANGTVALFGGLTPGTSQYYSNAGTLGTYLIGSVNEFHDFHIFYDQAGTPLYLTSPTCGVAQGGTRGGSWASPPIGANLGGWLGRDSSRTLAWAYSDASGYVAYFVMPEASAVGQTTTMSCKRTASPPPPMDGKTYASGAPAMPTADSRSVMTLMAK
jgi:hypothetical protein